MSCGNRIHGHVADEHVTPQLIRWFSWNMLEKMSLSVFFRCDLF